MVRARSATCAYGTRPSTVSGATLLALAADCDGGCSRYQPGLPFAGVKVAQPKDSVQGTHGDPALGYRFVDQVQVPDSGLKPVGGGGRLLKGRRDDLDLFVGELLI